MNWHILTLQELLEILDARPEGLQQADAEKKLQIHGPNELVREKKKPLWLKFHSWRLFIIGVFCCGN